LAVPGNAEKKTEKKGRRAWGGQGITNSGANNNAENKASKTKQNSSGWGRMGAKRNSSSLAPLGDGDAREKNGKGDGGEKPRGGGKTASKGLSC